LESWRFFLFLVSVDLHPAGQPIGFAEFRGIDRECAFGVQLGSRCRDAVIGRPPAGKFAFAAARIGPGEYRMLYFDNRCFSRII
jgi:hypothetical protein